MWDCLRRAGRDAGLSERDIVDPIEVIRNVAAAVGGPSFPPLTVPTEHYPHEYSPNACVRLRPKVIAIADRLELSRRDLAIGLAMAIYGLILLTKDVIPPAISVRLAAEIVFGVAKMTPVDRSARIAAVSLNRFGTARHAEDETTASVNSSSTMRSHDYPLDTVGAPMISRVERTRFANWWWTVDRLMLAAIAVLMMTGIVLSLAASPAVATRIGLDAFYFVNRHAMYLAPAFLVMIAVSFLDAAPDPAPVARRLHRLPRAHRRDAGVRRRGEGRAALDRARRHQHPAVRIREAGLRDPDLLAVRRIRRASPTCRRTRSRSRCSPPWSCRSCCSRTSARPC